MEKFNPDHDGGSAVNIWKNSGTGVNSHIWGKAVSCVTILLLILCLSLPSRAGAQTDITLSAAEKNKLDTFFSNFSEVALESFKQNSLSQDTLLKFALDHILYNDQNSLTTCDHGNAVIIPLAMVDRVTERYFGRKVEKNRKPQYQVPAASGEAHWFSQISKLTPVGTNLFRATGVIYVTGSGSTVDTHANPASYKSSGEDEVDRQATFSALIKKVGTANTRYILIEYQTS
jgi:hypothetical protein